MLAVIILPGSNSHSNILTFEYPFLSLVIVKILIDETIFKLVPLISEETFDFIVVNVFTIIKPFFTPDGIVIEVVFDALLFA